MRDGQQPTTKPERGRAVVRAEGNVLRSALPRSEAEEGTWTDDTDGDAAASTFIQGRSMSGALLALLRVLEQAAGADHLRWIDRLLS